jgi:hypothetical protein
MRPECIAAVQKAAEAIGKKLTVGDIRDIDTKIAQARVQLARQDITAYRSMTRDEQIIAAGKSVADQALHDAIKKKQRADLTVIKKSEREAVLGRMMADGIDRLEALRRFTATVSDGKGKAVSYESYAGGLEREYLRKLTDFTKFMEESSFAGFVTKKQNMNDLEMEMFGQDSGNASAKKAWKNLEAVRKEQMDHFNRLGGDIAPLANYRNGQALNGFLVLKRGGSGKDRGKTFVDDYMQWVDRSMYVKPSGDAMNDVELREFLNASYVTHVTDGANKPPGEGGVGSAANRMKAHRQIHYKSPEAYRAAMEKYGAGNSFEQARMGIESMAGDIALVDKFGPNAIHEFNKEYSDAVTATNGRTDNLLQSAFQRMSGQISQESVTVSHYVGEIKAAMVASRLGSMLFSQIADLGTMNAAARAMNIPKTELAAWIKNVSTDGGLRSTLRIHGLGIESALNTITRLSDGISNTGMFGKLASAIPTVQGAHLWTKSLRQAFGAMMEAKIGDMATKYDSMAKLPETDRKIFEAIGINDTDWAIYRLAKPFDYKGSKLMNAEAIENIPIAEIRKMAGVRSNADAEIIRQDAAIKFVSLVAEQSEQAILQPGALSQATMQGSAARGSVAGELTSLMTQFKSFPMAFFRQTLMERANFQAAGYNPMMFRANVLIATSMLGAMGVLLNELASGKDLRDLDTPEKSLKLAREGFLKGGGLGVFNEIIEAGFGSVESPWQSGTKLLGPAIGHTVGTVIPTLAHGLNYAASELSGEPDEKALKNFTKNAYNSIKGITPGQNLWFAKGILHNVLLDGFQEAANPGYKERAKERAAKQGQEYWLGYQ